MEYIYHLNKYLYQNLVHNLVNNQEGGAKLYDYASSIDTPMSDSSIDSYTDTSTDIESDPTDKKNGIFMMCIVNAHYIIGACIAAYCHRKLLEKRGIKDSTDLIMMCDSTIYQKYRDLLLSDIFFDRVIELDLRTFDLSDKYKFSQKYSSWIGMSLNKWQIMRFEEYEKVMLVDVALLPVRTSFYDLFDREMPGLMIRNRDNYVCQNGGLIPQIGGKDTTYDEYLENIRQYGTVHGKVLTMRPSQDLYDRYAQMTDEIYKDGIYSVYESGPDETSIFYFFMKHEIPVYDICFDHAVVSWDDPDLIPKAKAYSFTSMFKPWVKPKVLAWPEEIIWRDIYDRMVKYLSEHDKEEIKKLYRLTILTTYRSYIESNKRVQQKNYNNKYVQRYSNEFNSLHSIHHDIELFNAIMDIDSKIRVKYYGPMRTDELMSVV